MQFITEDKMKKFEELGYKFTSKYTPCRIGSTYNVIVTDKDGNEVVHTSSSYGNGSGHGYAMSFAQGDAVAQLEAIINGDVQEEDNYDEFFLSKLVEWDYINDWGYDKGGTLSVLFDSWQQCEGKTHWEYTTDEDGHRHSTKVIDVPSVYEKLRILSEKNLLKPSVKKVIDEAEFCFTDEYFRCMDCCRIVSREWDGSNWIETEGMEICDDCLSKSESAIEYLIEEAKDDFKKAVPVMVEEETLEKLGYAKLDEDSFSTRAEQWGEYNYGCHNIHHEILKKICDEFEGFPKLTWVGQFDCEYNCFFPTDKIDLAKAELSKYVEV